MTDKNNEKQGWGLPGNANKAHYFKNSSISLCGKWMFTGELFDTSHEHPQNCKACMNKRKKG